MWYVYGMRLRGFSPGAQPKGVVKHQEDYSGKYYDLIAYERKLTDKEVRDYELDFICERESE